jgi:predicted ArsR family transcriptional regulator
MVKLKCAKPFRLGSRSPNNMKAENTFENQSIPLDRDVFFRSLIRELAGELEEIVGLNEASGFVSLVGQRIGDALNTEYRSAAASDQLSHEQVTDALIDLKRRIGGDFYVIESTPEKIVLGNRRCPFGEKVLGRPSMCMMTSNVFGTIAADNLGFAKVELRETIAAGNTGCTVLVHLKNNAECNAAEGREYVKVFVPAGASEPEPLP